MLAVDETSAAILEYGDLTVKNPKNYDSLNLEIAREIYSKPQINHIHFDRERYWISFGKNREFFKKLPNSR